MINRTRKPNWLPSVIIAFALAGAASFCQAQSAITLSNDVSQSTTFHYGGPAGATYTWIPTNGPNGGGCIKGVIDGVTPKELDPIFDVVFISGQYYQVTFQMMVDPASGTQGTLGSGGYGNLQMALRDTNNSFVGVGYATIYPPAANGWVTYTYNIPSPSFTVAHLQFLLQGGAAYSAPVTIYIGDVTVKTIPNPAVISTFTNDVVTAKWQNYGMNASWDSTIDAPYTDPVTGTGPTSITPAGSVQFVASSPKDYQGGQLNLGFSPALFQSVAFDLYYDGPTSNTSTNYGGFQIFIAAGGNPDYNWHFLGSANFNANMIGKWTHFNLPCAAAGALNASGFAIQATPGSGISSNAIDTITFHIDNIQTWNPVTPPSITALTPAPLGGVQMTLDGNTNNNLNDQEGITSPGANNANTDYFWMNQTPATYSFTLTNFPSPASAPSFSTHIYLCNGDTITAFNNLFNYNQTYSGAPYNMVDYLGLNVQNGTNGGVVAIVDWKTNAPNSNATNKFTFNFPAMTSANGTWTLNFTDNTHGNVVAADGSVNAFTLPDFASDPSYTGNFSPVTSMVQFGIFKNGNITNNNKTVTLTGVGVTNSVTTLFDNFGGPGLTANNGWQVAEYYQFAANRAIWQPGGASFIIRWNTTTSGWSVQSSSNLFNWGNGGVTYTYADATGTNTLGAVQTTNLPAGDAAYFRLVK